jgi:hypothetical protein
MKAGGSGVTKVNKVYFNWLMDQINLNDHGNWSNQIQQTLIKNLGTSK